MTAHTPVFNPVAIIPAYNHPTTIGGMVQGVLSLRACTAFWWTMALSRCATGMARWPCSTARGSPLLRLAQEQGKGGAVMTGMRHALAQGYWPCAADRRGRATCGGRYPRLHRTVQGRPEAMVCGARRATTRACPGGAGMAVMPPMLIRCVD